MFNIGGGELLVIFLVALIVLGPTRLPGAARQVGQFVGELRRMSSGFQQELRDALDEPLDGLDLDPGWNRRRGPTRQAELRRSSTRPRAGRPGEDKSAPEAATTSATEAATESAATSATEAAATSADETAAAAEPAVVAPPRAVTGETDPDGTQRRDGLGADEADEADPTASSGPVSAAPDAPNAPDTPDAPAAPDAGDVPEVTRVSAGSTAAAEGPRSPAAVDEPAGEDGDRAAG